MFVLVFTIIWRSPHLLVSFSFLFLFIMFFFNMWNFCHLFLQAFCEALLGSKRPSDAELAAMIRKCSEIHGNLTKEAALGM
jgi:hypothetical protein